ncbi:MAG: hypothetical protein IJ039_09395 [Clostridia bacterium]|nr:hypothetical protein [Clostridia bacterium]
MKKVLTIALAALMLCMVALPVCAALPEEITPYYNNVRRVSGNLSISDDGVATISITYIGYASCTTGATVTSKLQKSTSSGWQDVSGASWTDNVSGSNGVINHTHQLSSTGTYRLVFEVVVSGTCGEADVISGTSEAQYS